MWNRKRNSDGFEWHHYVRTTIKLKRENRIAQVDAAKKAAKSGAQSAARKVWTGGKRRAKSAAVSVKDGAVYAGALLVRGVKMSGRGLGSAGKASGHGARAAASTLGPAFGRGTANAWAGIKTAAAYLASAARRMPLPKLTARAPLLRKLDLSGLKRRLPNLPNVPRIPMSSGFARGAATATVAIVTLGGAGYAASHLSVPSLPSLPSLPSFSVATLTGGLLGPSTETLTGRASALDGETLRINGHRVKLAGVAAPLRNQVCRNSRGRRWLCGRTARRVLARLVRRETVVCEVPVARDQDAGPRTGTCRIGARDVAETLIARGAVFASSDATRPQAQAEQTAKADRSGLWRGEADRPEQYRETLWARAKRRAPDGCPIKGRRLAAKRVYLLPWSPQYRRTRVRERRGDRWFCSEDQAIAAGWQPADAG
ncbi:MAG: hypothetical protein AAFQ45_14485 [Pseudomonadota bacterium]